MLRAVLIATSLALSSSSFAQQVRVISGDIEHVYGPGGELLDDANLQARNKHAEQMQAEKQLAIRRQQEAAITSGVAQNWGGMAPNWDSTDGGWWGSGAVVGSTRGFFRRGVIRPRIVGSHHPAIGRR